MGLALGEGDCVEAIHRSGAGEGLPGIIRLVDMVVIAALVAPLAYPVTSVCGDRGDIGCIKPRRGS